MQTFIAALEISLVVSQKISNQSTSRNNTSLVNIPKIETITPQGHLLYYVQSSIIHDSQNLETTYMLLSWKMDKENVLHLHIYIEGYCSVVKKKQWHLEILQENGQNYK